METEPAITQHPCHVLMPLWKQLIVVTLSLATGGFIGALVAAVPTVFVEATDANGTHHAAYAPLDLIIFGILAAVVTVPSALIVGIPGFLVLRRFRMLNLFATSSVGLITSALVSKTAVTLSYSAY
jgi:hypothetical protein